MEFSLGRPLNAGEGVDLEIRVTDLGGPANGHIPSRVVIEPAQLCVSRYPMGDVTLDERASSPDAVQVLRRQERLPLARGVDQRRGDVDCPWIPPSSWGFPTSNAPMSPASDQGGRVRYEALARQDAARGSRPRGVR